MAAVLDVRALTKTFKGGLFEKSRRVLDDVSFQIPAGATAGFVGGNGHGKTTTIKCLLGFVRADSGDIKFFGEPLSVAARAKIGYLPERPYLYEFLTGREFLRFHWKLGGGGSSGFPESCARVLKAVDLEGAADLRLRQYSKGMLQRMGLAQALLHKPELLILDEPMSGLDPDGRLLVKDILREQRASGVTVFFSSHLLQDMDELCDHLTVIDRGRIVADGPPELFRKQHPGLEEAFRAYRRGAGAPS